MKTQRINPPIPAIVMGILAVGTLVVAFGVTGRWDYEEARRAECAYAQPHGLAYDATQDKCVALASRPSTNQ